MIRSNAIFFLVVGVLFSFQVPCFAEAFVGYSWSDQVVEAGPGQGGVCNLGFGSIPVGPVFVRPPAIGIGRPTVNQDCAALAGTYRLDLGQAGWFGNERTLQISSACDVSVNPGITLQLIDGAFSPVDFNFKLTRYPGNNPNWYYAPAIIDVWPGCTVKADLLLQPKAETGAAQFVSSVTSKFRYQVPNSENCKVEGTIDTALSRLGRVSQAFSK